MARKIVAAIGLFVLVAAVVVAAQGMSAQAKDAVGIMITIGIMIPFAAIGLAAYRTTIHNTAPRPPRMRHYDPWQAPAKIIDAQWKEVEGTTHEVQVRRQSDRPGGLSLE